jgi:DNA-binding NarL/FixJ family response regulator
VALFARDAAPGGADSVSVYVVEDHRLLREGTATMLAGHGFRVVGAASGGPEALEEIEGAQPRVVLLDSGLPDAAGIAAELKLRAPLTDVIAMSFLPDHARLVEFIRAGVAGFILKDATAAETVATIRRVVAGAPALPRALGGLLASHVASQAAAKDPPAVRHAARLTRREREVVALIADGLSNKEIAVRLHLATDTVKTHVHGVLEKLGLKTRLQIAAYAHGRGEEP